MAVARLMKPHMMKEEEFALPPLALLAAIARGKVEPWMAEAIGKAERGPLPPDQWPPPFELPIAAGCHREFCVGPGAHTHYWDGTAYGIAEELDRLIATTLDETTDHS